MQFNDKSLFNMMVEHVSHMGSLCVYGAFPSGVFIVLLQFYMYRSYGFDYGMYPNRYMYEY